jgi:hypothetical protein
MVLCFKDTIISYLYNQEKIKRIIMKRYLIILTVALFVTSCKTQQLYLNITEPAPVTVPAFIKSVGVIDRTAPTDNTKKADQIEKVLTLEGSTLDSVGKEESIKGLADELLNNNRFNEVKDLSDLDFRTSAMGAFPNPLSWDIVGTICNEQNVDAIFALEAYDTDTHVIYTGKSEKETPLVVSLLLEPNAAVETIVKTGWRIYDPKDQVILDEYSLFRTLSTSGSVASTALSLTNRKEAVKKVSNDVGHAYAIRLLPMRISVTRDYYVKGTNNFKVGKRKAQLGQWDEAGTFWEKETTNPKRKIAGRACYNMAILSEINGDFDTAINWAEKGYSEYRDKLSLRYSRILHDRKNANELLKVQEER